MEQDIKSAKLIIELFQAFFQLEWAGCGPVFDTQSNYLERRKIVPKIIWRFHKDQDNEVRIRKIELAIVDAVSTFQGKVEWVITSPKPKGQGRNWVITTKRFRDLYATGKYSADSFARDDLAATDPAHGQSANEDLGALLEHLKDRIMKALLE